MEVTNGQVGRFQFQIVDVQEGLVLGPLARR